MIYGVINKQLRCLGAQLHILFQPACIATVWLTHNRCRGRWLASGGGRSGNVWVLPKASMCSGHCVGGVMANAWSFRASEVEAKSLL
jgi:hypothetical protein